MFRTLEFGIERIERVPINGEEGIKKQIKAGGCEGVGINWENEM